jgi:alcohol dehydrogenase class IV
MQFLYESRPARVQFGAGSSRAVESEFDRIDARRVLLICSEREESRAAQIAAPLSARWVGTFTGVRQHVPAAAADEARASAAALDADALLSIGGGSTTGTAKAISLTTGLPIVAVPTTYAGSEMTPVWGITTDERKETGTDPRVLPTAVVYDPDLVRDLPNEIAVASALNALAHCIEAYWTPKSNPVIALTATEGVHAIGRGLLGLTAGDIVSSSERLLYGSFLAGLSYAAAGSGLHHKICHALGGAFDLPHAPLHAVILPHVLEFNMNAARYATDRIAGALGSGSALDGLHALYDTVRAPRTLREIGFDPAALADAIEIVADKLPIDNPRPVTREGIASILTAAL